jgi:hypothetical protein
MGGVAAEANCGTCLKFLNEAIGGLPDAVARLLVSPPPTGGTLQQGQVAGQINSDSISLDPAWMRAQGLTSDVTAMSQGNAAPMARAQTQADGDTKTERACKATPGAEPCKPIDRAAHRTPALPMIALRAI